MKKLTEAHKKISKHTLDIVKRRRQEVLDEGIYRDYIPGTRSSLPNGGGGRDDDDVRGSAQAPVTHAGSPTLAAWTLKGEVRTVSYVSAKKHTSWVHSE